MLPNDYYLLSEAQRKMKASHQEVESYRLAKLAAQASGQPSVFQRLLVVLGAVLSRAGASMQAYFGPSAQTGKNSKTTPGATLTVRTGDCP